MLRARVGNLTLLGSVHSGIVLVLVLVPEAGDEGGREVVKSREDMVPRIMDLRSGSEDSAAWLLSLSFVFWRRRR